MPQLVVTGSATMGFHGSVLEHAIDDIHEDLIGKMPKLPVFAITEPVGVWVDFGRHLVLVRSSARSRRPNSLPTDHLAS